MVQRRFYKLSKFLVRWAPRGWCWLSATASPSEMVSSLADRSSGQFSSRQELRSLLQQTGAQVSYTADRSLGQFSRRQELRSVLQQTGAQFSSPEVRSSGQCYSFSIRDGQFSSRQERRSVLQQTGA